MDKASVDNKQLNRRVAFRIYDQVNLFYQKIDSTLADLVANAEVFSNNLSLANALEDRPTENQASNSPVIINDTQNANISVTGMAFTCEERLKSDDLIAVRILLLSSMTTIMTYCQVVYCKPSNPYEHQYPYWIGARFVNMSDDVKDLLDRYVQRKRKQQMWVYGGLATLALIVMAFPLQVFHLVLVVLHHLVEIVLHGLFLCVEFLELNLDHLIEHWFHTSLHATQIIVFYILAAIVLLGLYSLWRIVPAYCIRWKNRLVTFWMRKKASLKYFWNEQSLDSKIKITVVAVVTLGCYSLIAF